MVWALNQPCKCTLDDGPTKQPKHGFNQVRAEWLFEATKRNRIFLRASAAAQPLPMATEPRELGTLRFDH